jgi:Leucine-rich repeat (LRR) protein
MRRNMFFIMIAAVLSANVFAEESDASTLQTILEKCGFSGVTANDVAVMEEGHVITLNLTNKDVGNDGISVIPVEIANLSYLRELILSGNSIETVPPEIGRCVNLRKLDLGSNRIAVLPSEIGNLVNLTYLDLRHNALSDLPPEIGKCGNLEYLWLWGNKLTKLDPAIIKLRRLKELYLNDNRLTTLPVGIVGMRFKYIDLVGNKLCNMSSVLDAWAKKMDNDYKSMQKCL